MQRRIWLFVLCCFIAACAKAPSSSNPPAAPVAADPPQIKSTDVVQATPQEATITRGESADIVVPLRIKHGYHVNANPPTLAYLKPTELELPQTNGLTVEFISYPDGLKRKFPFADQELAVYEGEAIVRARVKADKSAQSGKRNLSAKLRVQACDDKVCYAPGVLDVTVPVNIQ